MAVKTFASGETLTAADTNTYLNNGGLVYVKSQTVGSAVTSVTVTNAFSADYDHYRILYKGACTGGGEVLRVRMGATTTGYYGNMIYANYTSGTPASVGDNNTANWTHCGGGNTSCTTLDLTLFDPFLAKETQMATAIYFDLINAGKKTGHLANSTSYTDFTLIVSSGTITGGTIRVYGYRQA